MTRSWFGDSTADFVVEAAAEAGAPIRYVDGMMTVWDAETGGTQYTDLLVDGDAATTVPVLAGQYRFQGPNDVVVMWAEVDGGDRVLIAALGDVVAQAAASAAAALAAEEAAIAAQLAAEAVGASSDAQTAANVDTGPLTGAALSASTADILSGAAAVDVPGLFAINDGTGRAVSDKVSIDPTGGTGNDQLALWQIFQTGKGRLMHFTNTGAGLTGVRDFIGMGLSEGSGLLVSVKGEGPTPGQAKGINAALQADAIAGANALFVGQYNAVSPAASFQALAATHKPVLELVAVDPAAGQQLFRVQHAISGVYTTTEYIDSLTGVHVFSVQPDFTAGTKVRNIIDTSLTTADVPRLRMQATSGQTANLIEAFPVGSTASYLFNVTAAGRILGARAALNTGGTTGGGTLSVNGEGAALANAIFRAHASAPGDLAQFTDSASVVYSRVNKAGYYMTAKVAAPADADLSNAESSTWHDPTNGAAKFMVKAKETGGTVRSIGLPLSPVALAAVATDPATTQTLVNDIRTKLIATGMYS